MTDQQKESYNQLFTSQLEKLNNYVDKLKLKSTQAYEDYLKEMEKNDNLHRNICEKLKKVDEMSIPIYSYNFYLKEEKLKRWRTYRNLQSDLFTAKTRPKYIQDLLDKTVQNPNLSIFDQLRIDGKKTSLEYSNPYFLRTHWIKKELSRQEEIMKRKEQRRMKKKKKEPENVTAAEVRRKVFMEDGRVAYVNENNELMDADGNIINETYRKNSRAKSISPNIEIEDSKKQMKRPIKKTKPKPLKKSPPAEIPPLPNERAEKIPPEIPTRAMPPPQPSQKSFKKIPPLPSEEKSDDFKNENADKNQSLSPPLPPSFDKADKMPSIPPPVPNTKMPETPNPPKADSEPNLPPIPNKSQEENINISETTPPAFDKAQPPAFNKAPSQPIPAEKEIPPVRPPSIQSPPLKIPPTPPEISQPEAYNQAPSEAYLEAQPEAYLEAPAEELIIPEIKEDVEIEMANENLEENLPPPITVDINPPPIMPENFLNVNRPERPKAPAVSGDKRMNLLDSIRKGKTLKTVKKEQKKEVGEEEGDLNSSIFAVLQRRAAIVGSDSEEESESDGSWDD